MATVELLITEEGEEKDLGAQSCKHSLCGILLSDLLDKETIKADKYLHVLGVTALPYSLGCMSKLDEMHATSTAWR